MLAGANTECSDVNSHKCIQVVDLYITFHDSSPPSHIAWQHASTHEINFLAGLLLCGLSKRIIALRETCNELAHIESLHNSTTASKFTSCVLAWYQARGEGSEESQHDTCRIVTSVLAAVMS